MSTGTDNERPALHEYGKDGKCRACDSAVCSDAFWALFGAPLGTVGLRLRPGLAPSFISEKDREKK